MTTTEMLLRVARIILAEYPDDAKVRDIMHVFADEGLIPVDVYKSKRAEVEARIQKEKGESK